MSDASVITDVSETLRAILDAHLNPLPIDPEVRRRVTVTVDSPQREADDNDWRVNLYLYHILQDESRRNTGPIRRPPPAPIDPGKAVLMIAEPLPLKLYYMVSAFARDGLTEHQLIGEAIQALYTNRVLRPEVLQGGLARPGDLRPDVIQLVLLNQELETLHRIWGNFQETLRPSVTFEVDCVYLDALAQPRVIYKQPAAVDVIAVPVLTEVDPPAARPGAQVRLRGLNLDVRSPVDGAVSLVHILFDGVRVTPLPDRRSNRALTIVVPAGATAGPAALQLRIGELTSAALPFEVLAP